MLLQKLQEKQQTLGETDDQFSRRLGICRSFWTRMRNGKERINMVVIANSLVNFPELTEDIHNFLAHNVNK